MQDAVQPASGYDERPGRWVPEPSWPPPEAHRDELALALDPAGLLPTAGSRETLRHQSPQILGLSAGAWCAYGNPSDLPGDQRPDDAVSLTFDSAALNQRTELLGQPRLKLSVASNRPTAFVMARLCDVAPDGASTLITRGALNLCHYRGHATPVALTPGEPIEARVEMKSVAYALPAGHRLRLALSTSYWPWLWPSPEPVTLSVQTGPGSVLTLPVRPPPEDDALIAFAPPRAGPALPVTWLRGRAPQQLVTHDRASGLVTLRMARDFSGARRFPSGLEYDDRDPVTFTIRDGDPLSAKVECERQIEVRRGGWRTRVEVRSTMSADARDYHVTSTIEAYEGSDRIHSRVFTTRVPRDHT
jgi:predicted acyl esterase